MRDCTTGRTAKRMKPGLRSRERKAGQRPEKPVGAHHGLFRPNLQWTLGHTTKEVNDNSLLACSSERAPRRMRQPWCPKREQSVAIGRQRGHLSVLCLPEKAIPCPPTRFRTRAEARQPPRNRAKGSASTYSGHFGTRRSQRNRSARRRPPTSRRNRRSANAPRDLDRSKDRGKQRYSRIYSAFEGAS